MNNEYTQLSVDELAADPAVQSFVLKGTDAATWDDWLEKNPAQAVKMMKVQRILHQLDEGMASVDPIPNAEVNALWDRIAESTTASATVAPIVETKEPAKVVGMRGWVQRKQWGRVVAMAAAAVGALYFLFTLELGGDLYRTEAGEERIVELPDGSKVYMAPASTLRVKYSDDSRELNLLGDAFFEVEKGSPFTVHTAVGDVAVLGTSFSVEAREALTVACATGKVKVTRKADEVLLTRGLAVAGTPAGLADLTPTTIEAIAPWREGRLVVKAQSVSSMMKTFERYYPRGFDVERNLLKKQVNLEVPTNDFPLAIERINFVLQTQVDTSQTMIKRN
ncbi:MAG: FecR family protein [Saprospiraceae bacterium]